MVVCKGASRSVVLVGKLALKFPSFHSWQTFLWGLLGNMQEREFSKAAWPELCPVVFSIPGGFLTVMRRANPITDEQWSNTHIPIWRERGNYTVPVEDKQSSFGVIDGKIVAVDYGGAY